MPRSFSENSSIDVVIPVHEKDVEILDHCIDGIKNNISPRRIIVVSKHRYTNKAEWFDESLYPFSYQEVSDILSGSNVGWNYQQLLKLYAVFTIKDISKNVLIVDADTVFYKKVKFFDNGIPLYNLAKDKNLKNDKFYHSTLNHIKKILPEIEKKIPKEFHNVSGICHHMLFQKHILEDLFLKIKNSYHDPNEDLYKILLKTAEGSFGIAEYNLYFFFLVSYHQTSYKIRILKYKNTASFNQLKEKIRFKYHYCSYHSYMRTEAEISKFFDNFYKKIKRFFYVFKWNIGVLPQPIHLLITQDISKINWIKNPIKTRFYADPFGFNINGEKFIIFEEYCEILKRGKISLQKIEGENLFKKTVLDNKKHLSYPFVFEHENEIYIMPESYKDNRLSLYKINKDLLILEKIRDIFIDFKAIDPTLIFYQNVFWIFFTTQKNSNQDLHIAYCDSLFGEFEMHPNNPVKSNKHSSRPAGSPFIYNNKLYRPSQNCLNSYGESVVINEVVTLDKNNFAENFVREIKIKDDENLKIHTISKLGQNTLIDVGKEVFVIYKPLISIARNFYLLISKFFKKI